MNRLDVSPAIWAALDACASAGNLHRGPLFDCIKIGWPVRGDLGGWGYSDGASGAMRFPHRGAAFLALATASVSGLPLR